MLQIFKNGRKTGGCIKGKNCSYFHPPLCWNSEQNRTCSHTNCRFLHLPGTKVVVTSPNKENHSIPTGTRQNIIRTSAYKPNSSSYSNAVTASLGNTPKEAETDQMKQIQDNFLDLKQSVKIIQEQMLLLMSNRQPHNRSQMCGWSPPYQ